MKIAIIPARGGSKRIPNKNIRTFAGRPLIDYSIAAARESGCFDRVLVSTDSHAIAKVSLDCGAEVPFMRPTELADDHTGTGEVMRHALGWLRGWGAVPEFACCIYATAPFLTGDVLRQGLEKLQAAPEKQFAFSVASFSYPVQRALRLTLDGGVEPIQPECIPLRSQDLEEAYHDAGQFYWARAGVFEAGLSVFAHHSIPIVLPRHRVQDIDTQEDWTRAEYMFRAIQLAEAETNADRNSG